MPAPPAPLFRRGSCDIKRLPRRLNLDFFFGAVLHGQKLVGLIQDKDRPWYFIQKQRATPLPDSVLVAGTACPTSRKTWLCLRQHPSFERYAKHWR